MKILQYIHLYMKNAITQIARYYTFHPLRYVHLRYAKCLFTNIQKQQNTLKSSLLFNKNTNLQIPIQIIGIKSANFSGYYF